MKPDDILANADRLIADAKFLHIGGRSRSAATLVVVAIEQFGLFVEELAKAKYPEPTVHLGIFGGKANAHAKRQDALAAHILNYTIMRLTQRSAFEQFFAKTGCGDAEQFLQWMVVAGTPLEFTVEQKQRMRTDPDHKVAELLLHLVRKNRLKELREYGFYEGTAVGFGSDAIRDMIDIAEKIRKILDDSRNAIAPSVVEIAGINMPDGQLLEFP